jgi:hypothetical protein
MVIGLKYFLLLIFYVRGKNNIFYYLFDKIFGLIFVFSGWAFMFLLPPLLIDKYFLLRNIKVLNWSNIKSFYLASFTIIIIIMLVYFTKSRKIKWGNNYKPK